MIALKRKDQSQAALIDAVKANLYAGDDGNVKR